jgi:hypothetical protein
MLMPRILTKTTSLRTRQHTWLNPVWRDESTAASLQMSILVPKQKSIASAAKEIQQYLQEADRLNV